MRFFQTTLISLCILGSQTNAHNCPPAETVKAALETFIPFKALPEKLIVTLNNPNIDSRKDVKVMNNDSINFLSLEIPKTLDDASLCEYQVGGATIVSFYVKEGKK